MTDVRSASATDVGAQRAVNQDRVYNVAPLFAVADGMGGHVGGEVAAHTAIEALAAAFSAPDAPVTLVALVEAMRAANAAVWDRSREDEDLRGMGTTLTAAVLLPAGDVAAPGGPDGKDRAQMALANVGDSRSYLLRDGALTQVSADHSLVGEMVRRGQLTPEAAEHHPHRHILTRALGVSPEIDVDCWTVDLANGDRVLLCTDGLTNELTDAEIGEILMREREPDGAVSTLVDAAYRHGGSDNITALVVEVLSGPPEASPPPYALTVPAGAPLAALAMAGDGRDGAGAVPGTAHAAGAVLPSSAPPTLPGAARPEAPAQPSSGQGASGQGASDQGAVGQAISDKAGPAPEAPDASGPSGAPSGKPGRHQPRRITFRAILFVLLVGAVVAGAIVSVRWYAENSYFVGLGGPGKRDLVIYRGRPGGYLWFSPRIVDRTKVTTKDILASRLADLESGVPEPDLAAARAYVANLRREERSLAAAEVPPTTTTLPPSYPFGKPPPPTTVPPTGSSTTPPSGAGTATTLGPTGTTTPSGTSPGTSTSTSTSTSASTSTSTGTGSG